jgi:hypothetical protein
MYRFKGDISCARFTVSPGAMLTMQFFRWLVGTNSTEGQRSSVSLTTVGLYFQSGDIVEKHWGLSENI